MGEPGLVVIQPGIIVQELPGGTGQQVRDGGPVRDEPAPAAERGQLPGTGLAGRACPGCLPGGVRGHQRLSASANGSKIFIGMTFASGSFLSSPAVGGAASAGTCGRGW